MVVEAVVLEPGPVVVVVEVVLVVVGPPGMLKGSAVCSPRVQLGPIEEPVLVAVDADAGAVPRRDTGVRQLLPRDGQRADLRVGEQRLARAVGAELSRRQAHGTTLEPRDRALHDHVALVRRRARDQEIDARPRDGAVRAGQRDLLADDRRQVGVELEHELLEVLRVRDRVAEHVRPVEAEGRVDAAVVQEPEAAHLRALVAVVPRAASPDRRHAEHADLLVEVPQVRSLNIWVSASKVVKPSVPKWPFAGSSTWHPLQSKTVSVMGPLNWVRPATAAPTSWLSSGRFGFGGYMTCRMKSVKRCMSGSLIGPRGRAARRTR